MISIKQLSNSLNNTSPYVRQTEAFKMLNSMKNDTFKVCNFKSISNIIEVVNFDRRFNFVDEDSEEQVNSNLVFDLLCNKIDSYLTNNKCEALISMSENALMDYHMVVKDKMKEFLFEDNDFNNMNCSFPLLLLKKAQDLNVIKDDKITYWLSRNISFNLDLSTVNRQKKNIYVLKELGVELNQEKLDLLIKKNDESRNLELKLKNNDLSLIRREIVCLEVPIVLFAMKDNDFLHMLKNDIVLFNLFQKELQKFIKLSSKLNVDVEIKDVPKILLDIKDLNSLKDGVNKKLKI